MKINYYFIVDTTPPLKKVYWDDSNTVIKHYMTLKEAAYVIRLTTWKANQTKYFERNISYLSWNRGKKKKCTENWLGDIKLMWLKENSSEQEQNGNFFNRQDALEYAN